MCAARWVCRNGLPRQIAARQELAVAVRRRLTPRMRPPVVQQCMEREGICPRRICRLSRSPPRPWARFYTILVYGPPRLSAGRSVCCPACSRVMPYHANPSPVPTASPPRRGSHARRLSLPPHPSLVPAACPRYRCRTMSPQRAAVSSRGISAVTCSRNAPPYHTAATLPPFRASVSLLFHAAASLPYHAAATP